eukprot:s2845_g2.t1
MVAPRFTKACADLLRKSWSELPETFTKEVFDRLLTEDKEVHELLSSPVVKEFQNMRKVISRFLGLLEPEAMPQFEKLAHALAVAGHGGGLRLSHIAAMKRSVVRVVTSNASKQQRESVNRAWEAFFYALAAVVEMLALYTLSLKQAKEMSLNISALRPGSNAPPEEVMTKLREARGWLLDCIREDPGSSDFKLLGLRDVNAYCGLLSSVYGQMPDKATQTAASEETEKRLWLRRAAEVPLRVAELSTGTAAECLRCKSYIKASLKGPAQNVSINLRDMGLAAKAADFDKRLARIRDTEPPWEDREAARPAVDEMSWAGLMVVLMQASSPPQSENDTPVRATESMLGAALVAQGHAEEASALLTGTALSLERSCGSSHPQVLTVQGTLALAYADTGRRKEAENLQKVLSLEMRRISEDDLQGPYSEAVKAAQRLAQALQGRSMKERCTRFCAQPLKSWWPSRWFRHWIKDKTT